MSRVTDKIKVSSRKKYLASRIHPCNNVTGYDLGQTDAWNKSVRARFINYARVVKNKTKTKTKQN